VKYFNYAWLNLLIGSIRSHWITGSPDELQGDIFGRDEVVVEDDVDVELEPEAENVGVGGRTNEVSREDHVDRDLKISSHVAEADLETFLHFCTRVLVDGSH